MLEVIHLKKSFDEGKKQVLKDISMVFEPGKVNIIIGLSGSGKTTLVKCLVGLTEADSGSILYNGRNFSTMNDKERREIRKEMGMLFQGGALFDSLTVLENVLFPLDTFSTMSKKEKIERAEFCLKRVKIENAGHLYPAEISGGMKKRVAIARAIVMNPKYLFCDEPNSGLDPQTAIVIDQLIQEITDEYNITTIVNTHDMNSVLEIGDKIFYIIKGNKYWEGNNHQLLETKDPELQNYIYASKLLKQVLQREHN